LIAATIKEHTHALMCSALTYSFLQCPGIMPGFIRDGARAHIAAYAPTDEISPGPATNYGPPKT